MKDLNGTKLKVGQVCRVHPSKTSICRKPYFVEIISKYKGIKRLLNREIMASIEGHHEAWINDYLLKRMEVVGSIKDHFGLLKNQSFE